MFMQEKIKNYKNILRCLENGGYLERLKLAIKNIIHEKILKKLKEIEKDGRND